MDFGIREIIIAIITTDKEMVNSCTSPVFYAKDEEHKEKIAMLISKSTTGMVHDIGSGTYIVVRH